MIKEQRAYKFLGLIAIQKEDCGNERHKKTITC